MNAALAEAVIAGGRPAEAEAVLDARWLSFAHVGAGTVFEGISLSIRGREIVALLGSSGCGKSTLLPVLAGLETPATGEVCFLGQPKAEPHPRSALVQLQTEINDTEKLSGTLNVLASLIEANGDPHCMGDSLKFVADSKKRAYELYIESLSIREKMGDKQGMAQSFDLHYLLITLEKAI